MMIKNHTSKSGQMEMRNLLNRIKEKVPCLSVQNLINSLLKKGYISNYDLFDVQDLIIDYVINKD